MTDQKKLYECIQSNDLDGVREALENPEVDVNQYNTAGKTPLGIARDPRIIQILKDRGAKVNG